MKNTGSEKQRKKKILPRLQIVLLYAAFFALLSIADQLTDFILAF